MAKEDGTQHDYVGSASESVFQSCTVSTHKEWPAGDYVVYLKVEDKSREKKLAKDERVTLATYSFAMPEMATLDRGTFKKNYPGFFEGLFLERARDRRKVIVQEPLLWYSQEFLFDRGDFGYFIAQSDPASVKTLLILIDEL